MGNIIIKKNILLKNYSTFKIGGRAKYFTKVLSLLQLKNAISWAKEKNIRFFVLGGGSNILFSDNGYNGLVIKIEISGIKFSNKIVEAGAGESLFKLVLAAKEKSLSGLEWAAGIPGTVGGAILGNAGAFGKETKDSVKEVLALSIDTLKEKKFKREDCEFSYRKSIFKDKKKYVIISATFALRKGSQKKIEGEIKKNILYRKDHHPLNFPSAGSIFKNIKIDKKTKINFKKFPSFKQFKKKGEIPVAYLIQKKGLGGKKIGGAEISEKHTNFIVNSNNAKAKDVISLISFIKSEIKNNFCIDLKEEIIFVK